MKSIDERILPVDYTDELKQSYIDYAMTVIISRAMPDVRDGLKPVHRRILFSMKELGLAPSYNYQKNKMEVKSFKKSARIVGDTMGKYHHHGYKSIYEALVNLSQDFKMCKPLIDGEGNFGSIDGDKPAQMRYTEARLSAMVHHLLSDMDKNVVDFIDNFDGTQKQPVVLPAKYPNLLVNGADGIAVGMATKIPPHNLSEVIDGAIELLKNPNSSIEDLMKHIKAPDFPTGGVIINKEDLLKLYETGQGKIQIRSNIIQEPGQSGRMNLIISEIPYTYSGGVNRLIEDIANQAKEGKLSELHDIKNQSSMEGVRIVLEVKKGVDIENLKLKLYKKTGIESSFSVNIRAIVDGKPKLLNLKEVLEEFLKFQTEIHTRKYQHLLAKATQRLEVLEGLLRAVDVIDVIIEVIRGSKTKQAIRNCMKSGDLSEIALKTKKYATIAKKFDFTELQIDAILNIQLIGLMGLELRKISDERDEIKRNIIDYEKYLRSKKSLNTLIKKELLSIKQREGAQRKTKIIQSVEADYVEVEDTETLYGLIDKFNYIKFVDEVSYSRMQGASIESYEKVLKVQSTERLIVIGSKGNSYILKPLDIGKSKASDRGVPLSVAVGSVNEDVLFVEIIERLIESGDEILFVTKKGEAKRVLASEYDTAYKKILALAMDKDDLLVFAGVYVDSHVLMASSRGLFVKIASSEIPCKKRASKGGKIIKVDDEDEIQVVALAKSKPHEISLKGQVYSLDKINSRKKGAKMKSIK